MSEYFKKAYDWAFSYDFEDIDIEYASKLALKMLDDSCQMNSHDREVFFNVYDALCDRTDISLNDEMNKLILLARNRQSIYSKPEFANYIHACKEEIIPSMIKIHMKAYKKLVRTNLHMV